MRLYKIINHDFNKMITDIALICLYISSSFADLIFISAIVNFTFAR